MSDDENINQEAPTDARLNGESFMQAMGELFQGTEASEKSASPDQVLALGMGKLQALGMMALYYEVRHGNDQQANQITLLRQLIEELRIRNSGGVAQAG